MNVGSPSCAPLAELGLGVQVASHVLSVRSAELFDGRIEPRVLAVRTFPARPEALIGR
jgi:L-asparaginase